MDHKNIKATEESKGCSLLEINVEMLEDVLSRKPMWRRGIALAAVSSETVWLLTLRYFEKQFGMEERSDTEVCYMILLSIKWFTQSYEIQEKTEILYELFLSLFQCCTIIANEKTNEDLGFKRGNDKKERRWYKNVNKRDSVTNLLLSSRHPLHVSWTFIVLIPSSIELQKIKVGQTCERLKINSRAEQHSGRFPDKKTFCLRMAYMIYESSTGRHVNQRSFVKVVLKIRHQLEIGFHFLKTNI